MVLLVCIKVWSSSKLINNFYKLTLLYCQFETNVEICLSNCCGKFQRNCKFFFFLLYFFVYFMIVGSLALLCNIYPRVFVKRP